MSPFLALAQLAAFKKGHVQMTVGAFDEAFDAITEFLGDVNDIQYKLIPNDPYLAEAQEHQRDHR